MIVNLDVFLINLIVSIIIISPILWLAGKAIVGGKNAKFFDAVWIVILGIVIGGIFTYFFTGIIAAIIELLIWIYLVKHFFDASWGQAIIISILAVVIFVVIGLILAFILGIALFPLFI